ncbi:DUF1800 domain-containing protein [Flavobacterium jejuense]|uniref:DUF1800 domain-containing protein n=1 Tax=Flavobacterium jejuense TaxID=1544455 RepID=A0ABX0IW18_9FLAO|nr:DUF1800 domain-containing protein [Flavobacterium jejuense]NHN27004.1 DUF1800 domain-containing protein [Flavobacterium jejuense]
MRNKTFTRRALIRKLFLNSEFDSTQTDPLFEKYSRKVFNGRKYLAQEKNSKQKPKTNAELERVNPVTSGLELYTGPWTDRQAIHLLKRTGFGFKKTDLDTIANLSMSQAVDLILNIDFTPPSPPINNYELDEPDENGLPYGEDWTIDPFVDAETGNTTDRKRMNSLTSWMTNLAIKQDITIREKMVLFWYHFIPVDFDFIKASSNQYISGNTARVCYQYIQNLRDYSGGNFKTLIRSIATQPAMMYYLNNQANTKTAPDENFAREIMELFTLGKGSNSQYSQPDVIEAAKVLTGWRVQNLNTSNPTTDFVANKHDETDKQFSPFFNNTTIPNNGALELDAFIDMIFAKSEVVSQYICRRLYRFFVYYDIDPYIEANIIEPLAQHFIANNWEIMPVLEKLFKSQHFYDMANRGVYIKSPLDLFIGFIRTFSIETDVSDPTNYNAQYYLWERLDRLLSDMGQSMGSIPNVAGWQAFYQNPSFHEYWINSNTIQKRFAYLDYTFYGITLTKNGLTTKIKADTLQFVSQFPNSTCLDPNLLVDECIKYLLPVDLSMEQKNIIKTQNLLSGQATDYYWTQAWNNYTQDPSDETKKSAVTSRLNSLFLTIIQLAEFQLM